ncbi:hypothetical protein J2Y64_001358 [Aeromonas salmonicida]|nr:hypothetical protein [Aeromonas salmonicida]
MRNKNGSHWLPFFIVRFSPVYPAWQGLNKSNAPSYTLACMSMLLSMVRGNKLSHPLSLVHPALHGLNKSKAPS